MEAAAAEEEVGVGWKDSVSGSDWRTAERERVVTEAPHVEGT